MDHVPTVEMLGFCITFHDCFVNFFQTTKCLSELNGTSILPIFNLITEAAYSVSMTTN